MSPSRTLLATLLSGLFIVSSALAQTSRVSPALGTALRSAAPGEPLLVWVYLRDKNGSEASGGPSARALERRNRRGRLGASSSYEDLAVPERYVEAIAERVHRVRHISRWLNAVSVQADPGEIEALSGLSFVSRLDVVRGYRRREETLTSTVSRAPGEGVAGSSLDVIDYGTSFDQLEQIRVPEVHARNFHGEGILVAIFDTGFNNLSHPAFAEMTIVARRDFVNADDDVADGSDRGDGTHGTATLSVLGGYRPGELVGPAFRASFLLAKTEDTWSETPIEEDHWAAAAEWAEAMGADVISSSLGYFRFDAGFPSYDVADMNGETAVTTRAAQAAAERGVVVVVSNGNAGFDPSHSTLGAPADGKLVLSVGAVDTFGVRADFSSVGPTADGRIKPDVMAKGVLVKVASPFGAEYQLGDGTSFSCPLAAGVAALVLQVHPDWNVSQILSVLRATSDQAAAPDRLMGWGILDAVAAIESVPQP
jgi:subtilisin family serine protease